DLHSLDIASGKIVKLTRDGSPTRLNAELDWVYPEELALPSAHWWSPDSRWIALLQFDTSAVPAYPHGDLTRLRPVFEPERYSQAGTPNSKVRLGVVAAGGGKVRWLELGAEERLIGRVTWLPDSSALAVHLLTRTQKELELRMISLRDGKGRTIVRESDKTWVNLGDDFRFLTKSREMIWGSERSGYRHSYLQPLDGGAARAITQGEWEVTNLACVDETARRIFYVSTEPDARQRQFYSIGFDGSGKRRLTQTRGTHAVSMPDSCGHWVDAHSSLADPPSQSLHGPDGGSIALLQAPAASEFDLLPEEFVDFRAADGDLFHARLIKPAGWDLARKYPAVVQVYGGPHAQNVKDQWHGPDWDQYLAHRGFVIWQVDNRGTAGRGHAWESRLYRRFGKQELSDQLEGVKHLVSMGFVDPERIAINGWSYGGFMTLYSLLNAPDTFRAGIAGAPVTDWRQYDTIYTERYLGLPQENEDGYEASSPVHQAGALEARLLMLHNFEDDNVLFQHSMRMMDALQKAGKQYESLLYPQKTHGVTGSVRKHMLEAMTSFLERNLK
ncbi:MAG: alpha/beta fold hydrolase, partial [Bryobacteraceae bacterium]